MHLFFVVKTHKKTPQKSEKATRKRRFLVVFALLFVRFDGLFTESE